MFAVSAGEEVQARIVATEATVSQDEKLRRQPDDCRDRPCPRQPTHAARVVEVGTGPSTC